LALAGKQRDAQIHRLPEFGRHIGQHGQAAGNVKTADADLHPSRAQAARDIHGARILVALHSHERDHATAAAPRDPPRNTLRMDARIGLVDGGDVDDDVVAEDAALVAVQSQAIQHRQSIGRNRRAQPLNDVSVIVVVRRLDQDKGKTPRRVLSAHDLVYRVYHRHPACNVRRLGGNRRGRPKRARAASVSSEDTPKRLVINSVHAAYPRCAGLSAAVSTHVAAGLHRDADLPGADHFPLLPVHPVLSMTSLDWVVLVTALVSIVTYGLYRSRGSNTVDRYLLAGKSMPWYAMALSIMATQASAITFISTTGQSYVDGMRFVQFYFGMPLAMVA